MYTEGTVQDEAGLRKCGIRPKISVCVSIYIYNEAFSNVIKNWKTKKN